MRDILVTATIIAAFAGFVLAHITIAIGLVSRPKRWRAPLAFVIPPLAPYFAFGEKMWARAALWVVCLFTYGMTRWLGSA